MVKFHSYKLGPSDFGPGLGLLPQRPGPAQPVPTLAAHQHVALRCHAAGMAGRWDHQNGRNGDFRSKKYDGIYDQVPWYWRNIYYIYGEYIVLYGENIYLYSVIMEYKDMIRIYMTRLITSLVWWFGTMGFYDFPQIGNNNPNWQTQFFQRGGYTTNQYEIGSWNYMRLNHCGAAIRRRTKRPQRFRIPRQ